MHRAKNCDMTDERSSDTQTAMDRSFAALRGLGVRRRTDDKWIAGVCSGFADRLGVDPVVVRAALILLTLLGGIGVTVYLLAWVLLPNDLDQIPAERALRDGDGGSIVLIVLAAFALFGGSWWGTNESWGFPWGLAVTGLIVWWLVKRSGDPEADERVRAQQFGQYAPAGQPVPGQYAPVGQPVPGQFAPAGQFVQSGQYAPSGPTAFAPYGPPRQVVPRKPRRRSGGPLMGLLAIGVSLATYGSLLWAGEQFHWSGDLTTIAIAGSLGAVGLLMVVLGIAGRRAGFLTFLAVILAISAWTSSVIPPGIDLGGRIGEEVWTPTSVAAGAPNHGYRLGVGHGVLDLSGLPTVGLNAATPPPTVPVSIGTGQLEVRVPQGLTVKVLGHVSLGEILFPTEVSTDGNGGSDMSRSIVIGDGPTDVGWNPACPTTRQTRQKNSIPSTRQTRS
jgi:phage shock protein PspC (stress-responsive transcriptional regulator)